MKMSLIQPLVAVRLLCALAVIATVLSGCGPKPTPGEADRERGEQAVDQLPR